MPPPLFAAYLPAVFGFLFLFHLISFLIIKVTLLLWNVIMEHSGDEWSYTEPIHNSSLEAWLNFDGSFTLDRELCNFYDFSESSNSEDQPCTLTCDSPWIFFKEPRLFSTCGIWALLVTIWVSAGGDPIFTEAHNHIYNQLEQFKNTSLDIDILHITSNVSYISRTRTTISTTMMQLWAKRLGFLQGTPESCEETALFRDAADLLSYAQRDPISLSKLFMLARDGVNMCIGQICAPIKLNPDLGGIGVRADDLVRIKH